MRLNEAPGERAPREMYGRAACTQCCAAAGKRTRRSAPRTRRPARHTLYFFTCMEMAWHGRKGTHQHVRSCCASQLRALPGCVYLGVP